MRIDSPDYARVRGAVASRNAPGPISLVAAVILTIGSTLIFGLGAYTARAVLSTGEFPGQTDFDSSGSPYATAADFTNFVRALRDRKNLPTRPMGALQFNWKQDIVTTVFWVGEQASSRNPVANDKSSWDSNWTATYGGVDTPDVSDRHDYIPAGFVPRQNPFYVALPYNDVSLGQFKPEAPLVVPWFKQAYASPGRSVCKDHWVAIRKGTRICYAQWEDCGPFRADHYEYVFGNERPALNANYGAGLDVSPAVRDYLGLQPIDLTDWRFVEISDVPPGPWCRYGENNPLANSRHEQSLLGVAKIDRK